MMMHLLAETAAAPDTLISGNWIIGVIGALATAAALILGKLQGRKQGMQEATNNVTIQTPVPKFDVNTREEPEFVTHSQLNGHLGRIEDTFEEIKAALNSERGIARLANSNIHARLDKVMENQAESRGELKQINLNVQRLLNQGGNKPPRA
jgi:hypothetical protein